MTRRLRPSGAESRLVRHRSSAKVALRRGQNSCAARPPVRRHGPIRDLGVGTRGSDAAPAAAHAPHHYSRRRAAHSRAPTRVRVNLSGSDTRGGTRTLTPLRQSFLRRSCLTNSTTRAGATNLPPAPTVKRSCRRHRVRNRRVPDRHPVSSARGQRSPHPWSWPCMFQIDSALSALLASPDCDAGPALAFGRRREKT
jgi:hypothetical protein